MQDLQNLFDIRHVIDLVLMCILLEWLALAVWRRSALSRAWPSLGAGLAMALALRFALGGAVWPWVWLCMAAAGVSHSVEVLRRWRA